MAAPFRILLLALSLLGAAMPGRAVATGELPAVMILTGRIAPQSGPLGAAPRPGDQVLAFSAVDGRLAGSGPVSADGDYLAVITAGASFNGTPLVLEIQQGRRRFALAPEGGPRNPVVFRGRTLPERTALDLRIGVKTADLPATAADSAQAQRLARRPADLQCTPQLDLDGDGRCDERDWELVRLYGGGMTRSVAHPN